MAERRAWIIVIDVVLAGDNAVVVGLAASRVAPEVRTRVIFWGMAGAVALRVAFAAVTVQLLAIVGLTLAGGILLLWVCWKMYRELVRSNGDNGHAGTGDTIKRMSFSAAVSQIILADLSMSLDNVLAVGAAAREHPYVLIFGLSLSIFLMGVAASFIARLLQRFRWIAYIGLAVILYVALGMIYRGGLDLLPVAQQVAGL